jgi:hypothetical protein
MDDFRVGSVPTSDAYGGREPSGAIARKREKHRDDQSGHEQNDPADIFEPVEAADNEAGTADEAGEDYYLPSDPAEDAE